MSGLASSNASAVSCGLQVCLETPTARFSRELRDQYAARVPDGEIAGSGDTGRARPTSRCWIASTPAVTGCASTARCIPPRARAAYRCCVYRASRELPGFRRACATPAAAARGSRARSARPRSLGVGSDPSHYQLPVYVQDAWSTPARFPGSINRVVIIGTSLGALMGMAMAALRPGSHHRPDSQRCRSGDRSGGHAAHRRLRRQVTAGPKLGGGRCADQDRVRLGAAWAHGGAMARSRAPRVS